MLHLDARKEVSKLAFENDKIEHQKLYLVGIDPLANIEKFGEANKLRKEFVNFYKESFVYEICFIQPGRFESPYFRYWFLFQSSAIVLLRQKAALHSFFSFLQEEKGKKQK